MTSVILKIDGEDYTDKVLERNFTIKFQVEGNYNDPVSSVANFVMHNDVGLENYFLNNDPFDIVLPGLVKIYLNDFPPFLLFKGYINRDRTPEDFTVKDLEIEAIGIEQNYAQNFANYDISQLYYELGGSTLRRGSRTTPIRYDITSYLSIKPFIETMFTDLGFNHTVNIPRNNYFRYKYMAEKYGDVQGKNYGILRYPNYQFYRKSYNKSLGSDYLVAVKAFATKEITKDDDASYNTLLKDWAALTGCVYFYHPYLNKWFFIPRDYNFGDTSSVPFQNFEDYIIDEKPTIYYSGAPNGLKIAFTDIALGAKREMGFPVGVNWLYGAGANSGDQLLIEAGQSNASYISIHNSDNKFRFGGLITPALSIKNTLGIKVNDDLVSYLEPGDLIGGDSVLDFIGAIKDNYEFLFEKDKAEELKVYGLYSSPKRIFYRDQYINVYDIELDIIENTSIFRFEYE